MRWRPPGIVDVRAVPPASAQAADRGAVASRDSEVLDRVYELDGYPLTEEFSVGLTARRWKGVDVAIRWNNNPSAPGQQTPEFYVVRVYAVNARGGRALVDHGVIVPGVTFPFSSTTSEGALVAVQTRGIAERYEVTVQAHRPDPLGPNTIEASPFSATIVGSDECDEAPGNLGTFTQIQDLSSGSPILSVLAWNDAGVMRSLFSGGRVLGIQGNNSAAAVRFLHFHDVEPDTGIGGAPIAVAAVAPGAFQVQPELLRALQFRNGLHIVERNAATGGATSTNCTYTMAAR